MKNNVLRLSLFLLSLLVISCSSDDGASEPEQSKPKLLTKVIQSTDTWSSEAIYNYDSDYLLTHISFVEDPNFIVEFEYNSQNRIVEANQFKDGELYIIQSYEYENGKLIKSVWDESPDTIHSLVSEYIYDEGIVVTEIEENNYYDQIIYYDYEYNDLVVKKIRRDSDDMDYELITYDGLKTPFQDYNLSFINPFNSFGNILKEERFRDGVLQSTVDYEITYDEESFPIRTIKRDSYVGGENVYTETFEYFYSE